MKQIFYIQEWSDEDASWGDWEEVTEVEFLEKQEELMKSRNVVSGGTIYDAEKGRDSTLVAHVFRSPICRGKIEYQQVALKPKK